MTVYTKECREMKIDLDMYIYTGSLKCSSCCKTIFASALLAGHWLDLI